MTYWCGHSKAGRPKREPLWWAIPMRPHRSESSLMRNPVSFQLYHLPSEPALVAIIIRLCIYVCVCVCVCDACMCVFAYLSVCAVCVFCVSVCVLSVYLCVYVCVCVCVCVHKYAYACKPYYVASHSLLCKGQAYNTDTFHPTPYSDNNVINYWLIDTCMLDILFAPVASWN